MNPEGLATMEPSELARILHVPILKAYLELEVRDKNGNLVHYPKQESHSWVRNAYNMIFSEIAGKDAEDDAFGAGKLNIKTQAGAISYGAFPIGQQYSQSCDGTSYGYRAPAAEDTKGILVGTGETAESFEDFALAAKIDNGTGAGELSYVESLDHSISYDGPTKTLSNALIRYFNNNSGAEITVNEVGLVVYGGSANGSLKWLVSRDLLAEGVAIPDTGQLKVTYTIELTYPS